MNRIVLFCLLYQAFGLYNIDRRKLLKTVPSLLAVNDQGENFCKDCIFFKKGFFTETKYGHCGRFPITTDDYLVDGVKDTSPSNYYYCSSARSSYRMCGPEGKYFESKHK